MYREQEAITFQGIACRNLRARIVGLMAMVFVAALCMGGTAMSQTILIVPSNSISTVTLTPGITYTVLDPGGSSNYPGNCNGSLVLSAPGRLIRISGSYYTETHYDNVSISQGTTENNTLVESYTGSGNVDLEVYNSVVIHFHSDYSVSYSGFQFTVTTCSPVPESITNITISETATNLHINWTDTNAAATSWKVIYGTSVASLNDTISTSTTSVNVPSQGLSHLYYAVYNNIQYGNVTDCVLGKTVQHYCVNSNNQSLCDYFIDLTSCKVHCRYGNFFNPDLNEGVVDSGPGSANSRHTVHTSTTERDGNTGNRLRTVPEGAAASVRLGNWRTGAEAESITYEYTVDTTVSDLLILKYAAVLEDPSHSPEDQPRFKFQILNAEGAEIDHNCLSADFIANQNLGWHNYYGTLWKDWTTVGVDLGSLHRQTIYVKLTTFDCERMGHFGYAYFVLDCGNKELTSSGCGEDTENTFTAPDGFSYRWYNETSPETTLSTADTLHVTERGTYRCNLSFVSANNVSCSFELSAMAGSRYPRAGGYYQLQDTSDCLTRYQFFDTSVVCTDSLLQNATLFRCDGRTWLFDDTVSSTAINPIVSLHGGNHKARLISTLGDGSCQDTLTFSFYVAPFCNHYDTLHVTLCQGDSVTFHDSIYRASGIYTFDTVLETFLYDTVFGYYILDLTVNKNSQREVHDTIVENQLPWNFSGNGYTLPSEADTNEVTVLDTLLFTNVKGCDSVLHYSLTIYRNRFEESDSNVCDAVLPLIWNGTTFSLSPAQHSAAQAVTLTDTVTLQQGGQHGEDSIIAMSLTVRRTSWTHHSDTIVQNQLPYTFSSITYHVEEEDVAFGSPLHDTLSLTNVALCDSIIYYALYIHPNVQSHLDSSLCETALPLTWNGVSFQLSTTQQNSTLPVMLADTVLLARQGRYGVDSTAIMTVEVRRTTTETVHDTIVENQLPYTFNGQVFAAQDTEGPMRYEDTLTVVNAAHCDSIINYSLYVWCNVSASADSVVCDNAMPLIWNGKVFAIPAGEQNGTATLLLRDTVLLFGAGQHDVDSTLAMALTVHRTTESVVTDTIIENQLPHTFNGHTYTAGEIMPQVPIELTDTIMLTNAKGCDSIIHYSLYVRRNTYSELDSTVCETALPIIWNGSRFALSAAQQNSAMPVTLRDTAVLQGQGRYGVDSIAQMTLHVLRISGSVQHDTVRIIDLPYTYNGYVYNGSVVDDTVILTNSVGCDSVILFTLHVRSVDFATEDSVVCENQLPVTWRGVVFRGSAAQLAGDVDFVLRDTVFVAGSGTDIMDSSIELVLTVKPTRATTVHGHYCSGQGYTWINGETYFEDVIADHVLKAANGCDSIVWLVLTPSLMPKAHITTNKHWVEYEDREVRLIDGSQFSIGRRWVVDGTTSDDKVIYLTFPADEDSLWVYLTAYNDNGCEDTASLLLRMDKGVAWAPNAFTPDEVTNNRFSIKVDDVVSIQVSIYSRSGQLLCRWNGSDGYWDGTYKGEPCPQGAYTYIISYTTQRAPRDRQEKIGTFLLLR